MSKQTFKQFKREWAEDWAKDDVNNAYNFDTAKFIIDVLADHYEQDMPDNLKDFKEWLMYEKGYDEDDANEFTEGVEDD
jgi:hypothetical protein